MPFFGDESQSDGDFEGLEFKGEAREYFSIWIVNLILSILTLGIYSAWAKVRRIKYFHSNTAILGDGLRYHATGWMILKGRWRSSSLPCTSGFYGSSRGWKFSSSFSSPFYTPGCSASLCGSRRA